MLIIKNNIDKIRYCIFSLTFHLSSKNLYKNAGMKYNIKDIDTLKAKKYNILNMPPDKNIGTVKKLSNFIALINKRNANEDKKTI